MKKTVLLLLILSYGLSTIGATVHLHYCMNKFVGSSLQNKTTDACNKCGMKGKTKNKCCKEEHKQLKLTSAHNKAGISKYTQPIQPYIGSNNDTQIPNKTPILFTTFELSYKHPPDRFSNQLYRFHSVFLI